MTLTPDDLLARLRERGIASKLYEHPPVLTVEPMTAACGDIVGAHTKNLFLRDGKKTYFLVTLHHDAQVDLEAFRPVLDSRDGAVSPPWTPPRAASRSSSRTACSPRRGSTSIRA